MGTPEYSRFWQIRPRNRRNCSPCPPAAIGGDPVTIGPSEKARRGHHRAGRPGCGRLAGRPGGRARPRIPALDRARATRRSARGQTFVAIESYSGAIALKRDSMLAYLKRGEAHQRRGDTPETLTAALRDLRTAAGARSGRDPDPRKAGRRQLRRSIVTGTPSRTTRRTSASTTTLRRLFYKLALASRGDGRLTRAIVALQQAVTLNPSFHEAYYVLGLCRKDRGELADARAAFERAIALAPAFISAREELADLHRLQQRTRDEIEQLEALLCPRSGQARALDRRRPAHICAPAIASAR